MDTPLTMPLHDRLLLAIESPPWLALYRIAIGFGVVPAYAAWFGPEGGWGLVVWFVAVLAALRLACMVLRRIVPASPQVQGAWGERRVLAKKFDSYQWRKLVWFGIGLCAYIAVAGRAGAATGALATFCLIGGVLGELAWRRQRPSTHTASLVDSVRG
jgi:hypothetical protein